MSSLSSLLMIVGSHEVGKHDHHRSSSMFVHVFSMRQRGARKLFVNSFTLLSTVLSGTRSRMSVVRHTGSLMTDVLRR